MKIFTMTLSILTALAVLMAGYGFVASSAMIQAGEVRIIAAKDAVARFDALKDSLKKGLPSAIALTQTEKTPSGAPIMTLGDVSEYAFLEQPVRVTNLNFLPMEWLSIRIIPTGEDVVQLLTPSLDIPRFSAVDVTVTILTKNPTPERGIRVEYYVFGHKIERVIDQSNTTATLPQ